MSLDLKLTGEDKIQAEIVQWAYKESKNNPDLWLLAHCPNGGWRGYAAGMRFKSLGVKAGIPDLMLLVAKGGFIGFWLEVKTATGKVADNQKEWHRRLQAAGHCVGVVRTAEEGINAIKWYLEQPKTK